MIDAVFKTLMTQPGIHASMLIDERGQLVTFHGNGLYDRSLLEGVSSALARALDSVELLHSDWNDLHVKFGEGFLITRNLGSIANSNGRIALAIVADASLNRSFATVAMRVVVRKLETALSSGAELQTAIEAPTSGATMAEGTVTEGYGAPAGSQYHVDSEAGPSALFATAQAPGYMDSGTYSGGSALTDPDAYPGGSSLSLPMGPTGRTGTPNESVMASALAWTGVDNNRSSSIGVAVTDKDSMELLSKLAKSLAPFVGPMAKVFVKEAVRDVCGDAPFARYRLDEVLTMLESQIEDPRDCQEFRSSVVSYT